MSVIDFRSAAREDAAPLPANIEAEQALLGCVLFDNEAFYACEDIRPDTFFEPLHGRLWAACEGLINKGQLAEPMLLVDRFTRDEAFQEFGGVAYLADLVDRAPASSAARDYTHLLIDLAQRRHMVAAAAELSTAAKQDHERPAAEIIEEAEQALHDLAEAKGGRRGFQPFSTHLRGAIDMAAAAFDRGGALSGLSTGLIDLDRKLGGLHPSDLVILAARPSMGKTALATNIAFRTARDYAYARQPDGSIKTVSGGVVALFSLEMSGEQLALRILAEASGISSDRLRRGEINAHEFGLIRDAAVLINDIPLHIDATAGQSVAQMTAKARRIKRTSGLDLVVVDYLQLASSPGRRGEGRVQEVSDITAGLKGMAKDLDVPVLALSQLSRQVEQRDNKRPQLSDLRESGSIEQDADCVMFLYREEYYLGRAEPREGTAEHAKWQEEMDAARGLAEVIIGKQRHGPIGTVPVAFNSDLTKFDNLARSGRFDGARMPYGGDE